MSPDPLPTADRAAEALRESEERYRLLVESSPDAIGIYSEEGNFLFVNAAAARIYGARSPADLVGRPVAETVRPEHRPVLLALRAQLQSQGRIELHEIPAQRLDGTPIIIETTGTAVTYRGERAYQFVARDITERKRAEDALRESEERYRTLIESLPAATYIARLDPRSTTVFVSPQIGTILGFPGGDLDPDFWARQLHPEDRERVLGELERSHARGEPFHSEYRMVAADGRIVWIHDSAAVVHDAAGQPLYLHGVIFDITARHESEEQARAALHEKEVLLKEIHHRVKNNLQVISSLLTLQSRQTADPRCRDALRDSQNRVRAMSEIHARLYASGDLTRVRFADYLRSLTAELFRSYNTDPTRVTLRVDGDDVPLVVDDAVPFGLIVNELISNALRHAFPEGRAGEVNVRLERTARGVRLTVADNGVGLPPDLDIPPTRSLGLQLVATLVRQLGGSITVQRSPGTTFTIEAPGTGSNG